MEAQAQFFWYEYKTTVYTDNGSTRYWPPGSLHSEETIFNKGAVFMWHEIIFIGSNMETILTTETLFPVPMNNYELLNI